MTKEKALITYMSCHIFRASGNYVDEEMYVLLFKLMEKAASVLGPDIPVPKRGESYNTFIERLAEGEDLGDHCSHGSKHRP